MTFPFKSDIIYIREKTMKKEKLYKEYAATYKDYLCGKCSFDDTNKIVEDIQNIVLKEAKDEDEIRPLIRTNNSRIQEIEEEVRAEYTKLVEPIEAELLDFLQFKGMIKGPSYRKRAKELKKKLQEYDGIFLIRKGALIEFFSTKMGSRYNELDKMDLMLRLGALDTKNL